MSILPPEAVSDFDPTSGIRIQRVFDGVSLASSQQPTGLGVANAIKVEFGAAQNTVSDPAMIDSAGKVTINEAGTYRIKLALQFGRTGASGTSILFFRALINGIQIGRTLATKLSNASDTTYLENDNWINFPAGTTVEVEIMRDSAGSNFGGLFQTVPSVEAGAWNDAPCAVIRVERWV